MRTEETHPPLTFYPPFLFLWTTVQFENYGLQLFLKERSPGDTIYISGEEVGPIGTRSDMKRRLVAMTHEIDWGDDAHGQTVRSAKIEAIFSDGSSRPLELKALPGRYFPKGGLYGGLRGWFQGDGKGKFYTEHDCWNLSDSKVRGLVRRLAITSSKFVTAITSAGASWSMAWAMDIRVTLKFKPTPRSDVRHYQ